MHVKWFEFLRLFLLWVSWNSISFLFIVLLIIIRNINRIRILHFYSFLLFWMNNNPLSIWIEFAIWLWCRCEMLIFSLQCVKFFLRVLLLINQCLWRDLQFRNRIKNSAFSFPKWKVDTWRSSSVLKSFRNKFLSFLNNNFFINLNSYFFKNWYIIYAYLWRKSLIKWWISSL